jgi:hypothetical protein
MLNKVAWVILSGVVITTQSAKAADNDNGQGWQLERVMGAVRLGPQVLYVDKKGVKFTYPNVGANILSTPPAWDVLWFNTKSHRQYAESLAHYRNRKGLATIAQPSPKFFENRTTYAGVKSREIQFTENSPSVDEIYLGRVEGSHEKIIRADYYVSGPIDLPTGGLDFLSTYCGIPNFGGIPLACHWHYSTGREMKLWYTTSVERKRLPGAIFAKPVGYTQVANLADLNKGQDGEVGLKGKLENFLNDMKVGEPFGK